ncbi:hypothetical protein [Kitasatospora camelliae]|uniref:Uncharacterized protein n=1 Tax=Kitasatospora camelliae TaxID=3156397 RepID=A0AAU8JQI1_9ACTN
MSLTSVTLASGRSIHLVSLHLWSTYGGLLEGYPCRRLNDRAVGRLPVIAGTRFRGAPVHVVTPRRVVSEEEAPRAFGPVETMPEVSCVGLFTSHPVDRTTDQVDHYSTLAVAWLQDGTALPSGTEADHGLRGVDWDALARDGEL